jgi:hypothetical protein
LLSKHQYIHRYIELKVIILFYPYLLSGNGAPSDDVGIMVLKPGQGWNKILQENSNLSKERRGYCTLLPAFATGSGHPVYRRGYVGNFRILIFLFMLGGRQNFFRKLADKFGFI